MMGSVLCRSVLGFTCFSFFTATALTNPNDTKLEAKVASYKGRNVIFVNDHPVAPLMYSGTEHSRETWKGQPRESIKEFTVLGYDIIQTDMWFKYSLRPDGTFDMEGVRKQLAGILEINPRAMIVVRINVSAPRWWLDQHPGERCRTTAEKPLKDVFAGNSAESLASDEYSTFARKYLRRFLEGLARTPEGNRVIGFHLGGGVYGEWHYYGIYNEPDASEPMRRKFVAFARDRYANLDQINAAWKTSFKSFDEIRVPSYDRRYEVADGDFRDPQRDRYVIDYYECQQATVSALVHDLAKITKQTWPRPTIVGLFWGYFYGGWTVGAQASQFDIKTMFDSPYVDYFSGPYGSRNMFGSGIFRSLAESVALHGKIWISEHDGGTHLGSIGNVKFPDLPRNEIESLARMRRNFMYTITENAGQWWYDFGPKNRSGWWSSTAMLAEAKDLLTLYRSHMEQPYAKPAEVLVVYDMASFNYVRPARVDKLTFPTTETLTDSLLGTGAAIDRVFLPDLPRLDLTRYKLVIFGNTFRMDPAQRTFVRERVLTPGRNVIFMSGAGYTDGSVNDVRLISGLIGINVEKIVVPRPVASLTLKNQAEPLDCRNIQSLFKVADPAARAIGTYASGETAAAVKMVNGARVYYFGVPLKGPLRIFKELLLEARVTSYVEDTVEGDFVSVGGGIIGIYSVKGGKKVIRPQNGIAHSTVMPPFSTLYFDLESGRPLNWLVSQETKGS